MDGAAEGWKAAAVSFWVERALRRFSKQQPLLEWQLIGEVKKWGPEKLPAGVSVKAYVKAVVQGLKADPRLQYRPSASGASPMFLAAAAPAPPEVRAAVEYWVEQIRTRAALGSRLTVAQLLDAVVTFVQQQANLDAEEVLSDWLLAPRCTTKKKRCASCLAASALSSPKTRILTWITWLAKRLRTRAVTAA
jgi:hypothetical protein